MQVDPLATSYAGMTGYQYGNNNPVFFNDPTGAYADGDGPGPPALPEFTWPDPWVFPQSWSQFENTRTSIRDHVHMFSDSDVIIVIMTSDPYDLVYLDGVPKGSAPQGSYRDDPNALVFESYDAYWRAYEAAAHAQQGNDPVSADQSDQGRDWLQVMGAVNGIWQMGTEVAINGPKPKYTGPVSWANQIKAGQNFTKKLGVLGMGITVVDAAVKGEWKPHHTADLIIGGVTTFLIASNPITATIVGGYFLVDLGVQLYSGKSITEHMFDPD